MQVRRSKVDSRFSLLKVHCFAARLFLNPALSTQRVLELRALGGDVLLYQPPFHLAPRELDGLFLSESSIHFAAPCSLQHKSSLAFSARRRDLLNLRQISLDLADIQDGLRFLFRHVLAYGLSDWRLSFSPERTFSISTPPHHKKKRPLHPIVSIFCPCTLDDWVSSSCLD